VGYFSPNGEISPNLVALLASTVSGLVGKVELAKMQKKLFQTFPETISTPFHP
jgi:hypothetical protein